MLKINELKINLREWSKNDFEVIRFHSKRIKDIAGNAGTGSDKFNLICSNLISLVNSGNRIGLYNAIKKPIDIRSFSYLLSTNYEFSKKVNLSKELIDVLLISRKRLSLLSLQQFIRAFFVYFDKLGSPKELEVLIGLIKQQLELRSNLSKDSSLGIWKQYNKYLFTTSGPQNIVKIANNNNEDLEICFNKFSLNGFSDGQFQQVCRYYYYLDVLKKISPGEEHDVLQEIIKPEVYNAPGLQGRLLGHAILTIMIDRIKGQEISDSWQNVILSIAGDPRTPKSSHKYQKWWMLLGETRISKVLGWLSRFDLNLFLNALESYGINSGNTDLQRMFPARKHFLEGLINQNLITNSRLFLSNSAEGYIKSYFKKGELPHYATVSGQTSMIYMQVGDFHIIEGSHSFKFWILPILPKDGDILDYTKIRFLPEDLRFNDVYFCEMKFGKRQYLWPTGITHAPTRFSWQADVIKQLTKLGISLNVKKLFANEDYKNFKLWHKSLC